MNGTNLRKQKKGNQLPKVWYVTISSVIITLVVLVIFIYKMRRLL